MANEVLKEYWYRLETQEDGRLRLRAAEERGNPTRITVSLMEVPPRRRMRTVDVWESTEGELCVDVPSPVDFERAPHLWIRYHIREMSGGAGEYEAVCEFTSDSTIHLVADDDTDQEVVSTIHGDSLLITGSFDGTPEGVQRVVWVELVRGGGA